MGAGGNRQGGGNKQRRADLALVSILSFTKADCHSKLIQEAENGGDARWGEVGREKHQNKNEEADGDN